MILSRTIFVIIIVYTTANLSSSSPILENDATAAQLLLLTARFDGLQRKTDQLSIQLEEEKAHRINLQAKNEELLSKNQKLEEKVDFLIIQINKTNQKQTNANADIIESKNNKIIDSPRAPPSSCRQLSTIGHYLDGIYLVANPDTNKIEIVYCEFGSSTLSETLFGNVEVKTKAVHFYVQRSGDFALNGVVIPFESVQLNEGGAMNAAAGVFTAPVDGIYHFEFSALRDVDATDPILVDLQVNGVTLATSYAGDLPNFLSLNGINASFRLKTGDQVRLYKTGGILNDNARHYTHFSGWLVDEDLALV